MYNFQELVVRRRLRRSLHKGIYRKELFPSDFIFGIVKIDTELLKFGKINFI